MLEPHRAFWQQHMSRVVRKPAFCICQNKDADQLRGNRKADQRLCFRYSDSTIPLPPMYENSSLWPHCLTVQPSLCLTWLETPKTGFLTTRLIRKAVPNPLLLPPSIFHKDGHVLIHCWVYSESFPVLACVGFKPVTFHIRQAL